MDEATLTVIVMGPPRETHQITLITKFTLNVVLRRLKKKLRVSTNFFLSKSQSLEDRLPLTTKVSEYISANGDTIYALTDTSDTTEETDKIALEALGPCGIAPALLTDRIRKHSGNFSGLCDDVINFLIEDRLFFYGELASSTKIDLRDPTMVRNQNVDLHDYTREEAKVVIRRALLNLDPAFKHEIKFMVGRGIHSADGFIMDKVLSETCAQLGFDNLTKSTVNEGYYLLSVDPAQS